MKDAFSFGPFRLHPGQRILRKDGAVVSLGSRAFDMLVAMVEHGGRVLTPGELMAIAWPGLIVEDSNVRVQVANLRRTLGCGRDGARYIANVAGRGYCFVEPVRRIDSVDPPSPAASTPGAAPAAPHVDRITRTSGLLSSFPPPLEGAIGREACVAELAQVVRERRLVTVVGAAGAGKTTLAILVAHARDASDGSIAFVDLSSVDDEDMVAEALAAAVGDLVDKSLVAVTQHSQGTHLRLLETTRAYAASRLAARRAGHELARRHALYYAEQLRQHVEGRRRSETDGVSLRPLPELENVRAALEWAFSEGHDPALAAEISGMAAPLLLERGLIRECKRTCERALKELPDRFRSTRIELGLLDSAAITYYSGGDYDGAMRHVVERGLQHRDGARQVGPRDADAGVAHGDQGH